MELEATIENSQKLMEILVQAEIWNFHNGALQLCYIKVKLNKYLNSKGILHT